MSYAAHSIIIIDHHQSAQKDLASLPKLRMESMYDDELKSLANHCMCHNMPTIGVHFDMEHSGAVLAWKFFFKNTEVPQLLLHIEDRDLWKFELDGTREIQTALFSYPYDMDLWDSFIMGNQDQVCNDLYEAGEAINRKHLKDINEIIDVAECRAYIAGYSVPLLNCPYMWASDACHIMAEDEPFAASYYIKPNSNGDLVASFSLRSVEDGVDVSEIATSFGGGGHKHAAGFSVDIETFMSFLTPGE